MWVKTGGDFRSSSPLHAGIPFINSSFLLRWSYLWPRLEVNNKYACYPFTGRQPRRGYWHCKQKQVLLTPLYTQLLHHFSKVTFHFKFPFSYYFCRYGNGASIFTTSGAAARKFQHEIEAGQVNQNLKFIYLFFIEFIGTHGNKKALPWRRWVGDGYQSDEF